MILSAAACSRPAVRRTASGVPLAGPLIPARTTIVTAWDVPDNPQSDPALDQSKLSQEIRLGFRIFTNTPREAPRFAPGKISCNNCHLNAGQRERSLPLVNVAGMFPEYNRRAGRLFTLDDRIVDCFLRSENATGSLPPGVAGRDSQPEAIPALPAPTSREVLAVAAYLTWLSRGSQVASNPPWRGQNTIATANLIPVDKLEPAKGEAIFKERCQSCHSPDGQGASIGDKRPGALWGPDSWNDGAGAARIYTLAGIIRYSMPYLDPGSLTDEQAQQVAAFIDTQPRPAYPFKDFDYRSDKVPPDAVYYRRGESITP